MATLKQKAAILKIAENHGNVSKTMLQVGYTHNTAKKPSNLTNSKGWEELLEKYLPDDYLLKRNKWLIKNKSHDAVARGLEMVYKLKKKYPKDTLVIENDISKMTEEEVDKRLAEIQANEAKSKK